MSDIDRDGGFVGVASPEYVERLKQGYWPNLEGDEAGREEAERFRDALIKLTEDPLTLGHVLRVNEEVGKATVVNRGDILTLELPDGLTLKVGGTVQLSSSTRQIVGTTDSLQIGQVATVQSPEGENRVRVLCSGNSTVVIYGHGARDLEIGDQVILDPSGQVALLNLGKDNTRFLLEGSTGVSWDDIGGLEDAIRELREAIEDPINHVKLFAHYYSKKKKKGPIKGILLWGPPGNGKTLLAKAAATALSKVHGGGTSLQGFIYVKGPELLGKFVGDVESAIQGLFAMAQAYKNKYGHPALIFIDEAEAILSRRGSGISSDIEKTSVPMFLSEMSGMKESGALVMLATNRPDVLDSAVTRDGRVDRKVYVGRPDHDGAVAIAQIHLKGVPFEGGFDTKAAATLIAEELLSPDRKIYELKVRRVDTEDTTVDSSEFFTLANLSSGAMIEGLVQRAIQLAIRRDKELGELSGVSSDDIVQAIELVFKENLGLSHKEAVDEFTGDLSEEVQAIGIRRLKQATI